MKNFLNLLKFALSKTPETALALVRAMNPNRWILTIDGEKIPVFKVSFEVLESFKTKRLVVSLEYSGVGTSQYLFASTRFKNDGSDLLTIGNTTMIMAAQGFDFDAKPFKKDIRVEMRFTTPAGIDHEIVLSNTL